MKKLRDDQKTTYFKNLIRHPLFETINIHTLSSIISIHYYPKNSLIYLQFDKVRYLYFLLDGSVTCHRQLPNGQEAFMVNFDTYQDSLAPIKIINESLPSLQDTPQPQMSAPFSQYAISSQNNRHQLTVKAAQNTFVALLPINEFHKIFSEIESSQLFSWYDQQISHHLSKQYFLFDLLNLKTAQEKIAYYLLAHANNSGLVVISFSMKNLAGILSIRAETLCRTLRTLRIKGIIETHNLGFIIHKPKLLLDILEH